MQKLARITLVIGLCITLVPLLLIVGLTVTFRRQITPIAVVTAAFSDNNNGYIRELFINRTYCGNANFSFDSAAVMRAVDDALNKALLAN